MLPSRLDVVFDYSYITNYTLDSQLRELFCSCCSHRCGRPGVEKEEESVQPKFPTGMSIHDTCQTGLAHLEVMVETWDGAARAERRRWKGLV